MSGLFKKGWFWLILILLIALIVFFFVPIKGCGIATQYTTSTTYVTYFNYLKNGCPLG